ncbi:MAG TPA: protein DA1 [Ignavibacteriales bacterium]|nr:protein DA1 [Ignavibacteriales bacterium]
MSPLLFYVKLLKQMTWLNSKHVLGFLLLLFLLAPIYAQAQECNYCGKKITGRYIEAGGEYFHPRHFLCARCGKVITDSFAEKDGKFFHPDCYAVKEGLVCDYCSKIIRGEYVTSEGKKYHPSCYENYVLPKCSVCGKPLDGEYTIDPYGNKYHSYHSHELSRCDNCSRIISNKTTGGGREYSDGRTICNLCYKEAVFDNSRINALMGKVMQRLKSLGLSFNERTISIRGVDRRELKKAAGSRYDGNMKGICNTSSRTEYINQRASKSTKRHEIFVLNGVPALNIESVIAHELMHVWLNDNTKDDHPDFLREGSCNYISYLYLRSVSGSKARELMKQLEDDDDDTYGKGFLKVKSEFGDRSLNQLLSYLKRY